MVGAGSTYYHLRPDNGRLFWDRLPMTLVFMSLLATTIGERVSTYAGKMLLVPLLAMGAGSVLIWRASGDLRLYCVVQFGAMIAVPVMLARLPARYSAAGHVWFTVLLYGLAKVAEVLDHRMAAVILTGGHPWKHLASALAMFFYVRGVACRRPLACSKSDPVPMQLHAAPSQVLI